MSAANLLWQGAVMNGFKRNGGSSDLAMAPDLHPVQPESSIDLGQLASKLNAIAAQLRGEESETTTRNTHHAPTNLHEMGDARLASNDSRGPIERSTDATRARVSSFPPRPQSSGLTTTQAIRRANADFAREIYATRRRRCGIFGNEELFGEPAWDILLDLYIAYVDDKAVSVSSACIGSAAPPTTGLRWLGVLAEHGLVLREHDPEDQRRVLVRLTDQGLQAMDEYFASSGLSA